MENTKNKIFDLDLNSDAFNAFKSDFNTMLKAILSGMEKNEAENGEISVTMKINLEEREVVDRGYARSTMVPSFSHKVVSKMQFKNEKKGALSGNFELRFDESTGKYQLVAIDDEQMSLFDDGSTAEEVHDMDNVIDIEATSEQKQLEGSAPLYLEAGSSDDDNEYPDEEDDDWDEENDEDDDEDDGFPI